MFKNQARVVQKYLKKTGKTQLSVSKHFKLRSSQYIHHIVKGISHVPFKRFSKFCSHLEIPPEELKSAMIADLRENLEEQLR